MPLPNSFTSVTEATGAELDDNFAAVGALTVIPCTVSGTDTLTLAPLSNTPAISAYANHIRFSGIAVADNTGATTARIGALGALNVYKDSPAGPVALQGGEIITDCAFTLIYDSALNSGAGGWHLVSTPLNAFGGSVSGSLAAPLFKGGTVSSSLMLVGSSLSTLTNVLSTNATVAFTVVPAQTAQDQNVALANSALGDQIAVGVTTVPAGAMYSGHVPAAGTIALRLLNAGAASIAAFTVIARLTAIRTVG